MKTDQHRKDSRRLSESLGDYLSHTVDGRSVVMEATNAVLEVICHDAGVVRVRARRPDQAWEPFSYAVCGEPGDTWTDIQDGPQVMQLHTKALRVTVQKHPLRVSFYSLSGTLLGEDEPAFGINWMGEEVTLYRTLLPGERFVGLGEKTGGLDRRGSAYVNWNTDDFAYEADADPLYASIPFFIGIVNEHVYGFYLDNSFKTVFNFGASSERCAWYTAAGGIMDYYFFHAPQVAGILDAYTQLTGRPHLPPKWSLGFHQCRYSYYPAAEVLSLARTFREKQIPADVIYLDIHYMDAYKVFTWHPERFPDPKGLCAQLKEIGFRVALILDPGVKVEEGYGPYDRGLAEGVFVQYPDGEPYVGEVWPGRSHFPDFTTVAGRQWWANEFRAYTDAGVEGFWNDMNEPAAWGQCLPNLLEFGWEGHGATHRQARNVYGLQMVRATEHGAKANLDGRRPFLLTRAAFAGVQRHSAVWTGDNVATEAHMLAGVRLVNSLGLSGVPFAGYDVGGFAGEASPALYARWISIGAFTPFFRGHTMINSRDSEPWAYGEEVEEIARNYIGLRYRLMPYIYSAIAEGTRTGMPLAQSLAIQYPFENQVYSPQYFNQYLFGPAILVAPSESGRDLLKVWLPPGPWHDLLTGQTYPGAGTVIVEQSLAKLPLFVKGGAVIAAQALTQHGSAPTGDTLMLHVYAGEEDYATYHYEDDGETHAYATGAYQRRAIVHRVQARVVRISAAQGDFISPFKQLKLYFHGIGGVKGAVPEDHAWIAPISRFDPLGGVGATYAEQGLPTLTIPFGMEEIVVQY